MEKVGFAACSTLILGWVCLWSAAVAGWTGGGSRGPRASGRSSSSSSFKFTESIMPGREDADAVGGCASFCGGAGGASWSRAASAGELPSGAPNGPRGSSTASNFVACPPYCFRRGPRPAGERGAAAAPRAEIAVDLLSGGDAA